MTLQAIGWMESPWSEKFGTPRQSGVVPDIPSVIHFHQQYRRPEALRGLEGFDWIWLLWEFSLNERHKSAREDLSEAKARLRAPGGERDRAPQGDVGSSGAAGDSRGQRPLTVRPPRLGGNERIGVFATRSPYRPNPIGLSSVRIDSIDFDSCSIKVLGADLVDGTPILDIKPYIAYSDSHPEARGGFTNDARWQSLRVCNPEAITDLVSPELATPLLQALQNDPRPHYQRDNTRIYGLRFDGRDIHFTVDGDQITIIKDE